MAKSELSQAFDRLNDMLKVPAPALKAAGEFAISIITLRTKKGLDADGNVFKPYVKRYASWRERKQYRASPPDLTVKGHMLGAMVPVPGDNEVTIEVTGTKEIAKVLGNSKKREFFDIRRDDELDAIAEEMADLLVDGFTK